MNEKEKEQFLADAKQWEKDNATEEAVPESLDRKWKQDAPVFKPVEK